MADAAAGNDDDESPEDESDEESREEEAPKFPFDADSTICVLDTRALCALPMDADEDGSMAFRAFLLPKGKTLHVPDEPGCYATLGPWRTQIALALVHFVKATSRKPELLLAFVDHGMLSNGKASGLFVSSLQLPLQKKRNVFEETPRMTKITDVSGFTPIDTKQQPWSTLLAGALKRQPIYETVKVYSPADIVKRLAVPLSTRIQEMVKVTTAAIEKHVTALGRQDARAAQKLKGRLLAQLEKTNEFLQALPPKKYDRRTDERIFMISPENVGSVAWLKTPQRGELQSGSAVCKPTARPVRILEIDPAPAPAGPSAATEAVDEAEAEQEFAGGRYSNSRFPASALSSGLRISRRRSIRARRRGARNLQGLHLRCTSHTLCPHECRKS